MSRETGAHVLKLGPQRVFFLQCVEYWDGAIDLILFVLWV